jgi:hypothetical protein
MAATMKSSVVLRHLLAYYLVAIGIFQLVLYALISLYESLGYLFYFDPRFGLFFLETILRQHEHMPAVLDWISATVIIAVGVWVRFSRLAVKLYMVMECLVAIPTLLIFLMVAAINMSPNHGFSRGELLIPVAVFCITSIVPVCLGITTLVIDRQRGPTTLGLK